ncbi:hypothetical protein Micbo1qcDRAFT_180970 [Microdochium bolleyi]|uniref:PPPDE domain-containing protein n=1 Tax=Microdochium bolleyi TaxID=196109 RepID=A0A136IJV7_9PEZI|nr:hypothetical protein Micbo1qcDRAFT_180970 [Microdochium bolleyi]
MSTGVLILISILILTIANVCCVPRNTRNGDGHGIAEELDVAQLNIPPNAGSAEISSKLQAAWKRHLEQQVAERLVAENDRSFGEPMWLSLYASMGSLKHWALFIHGQKIELRRRRLPTMMTDYENPVQVGSADSERAEMHQSPVPDMRGSSGFGHYYQYIIREEPSVPRMIEARAHAILATRRPVVDTFCIVLIGWTTKTKGQVTTAARGVHENFGRYNLFFNNCQRFLQLLASQVVTRKSQDWDWFIRNNLFGEYQYVDPEYLKIPEGAAQICLQRLKELKTRGEITDRYMLKSIDDQIGSLENYLRHRMNQWIVVEAMVWETEVEVEDTLVVEIAEVAEMVEAVVWETEVEVEDTLVVEIGEVAEMVEAVDAE